MIATIVLVIACVITFAALTWYAEHSVREHAKECARHLEQELKKHNQRNQKAVRMPDYSKPRGKWHYAGAIGTKATNRTTILIANNHECKEVEVPGYGLYFDPAPIGQRIADAWNQAEEQERLAKELEFQREVERDNNENV